MQLLAPSGTFQYSARLLLFADRFRVPELRLLHERRGVAAATKSSYAGDRIENLAGMARSTRAAPSPPSTPLELGSLAKQQDTRQRGVIIKVDSEAHLQRTLADTQGVARRNGVLAFDPGDTLAGRALVRQAAGSSGSTLHGKRTLLRSAPCV